jgi:photosystem II stability/assembly factor-like uncharacterized protein
MRARRRIGVIALAAVGLAACGGGSSSESQIVLSPQGPTTTTGPLLGVTPTSAPPATSAPAEAAPPTSAEAPTKWTEASANLVGTSSGCGNINVTSRLDQDMVFAGIPGTGLSVQTGGADQWTPIGTKGDKVNNRLTGIVVDPQQPQTFWESGSYGNGVFRTDDNGTTFKALGNVEHVDYASLDFTDPKRSTILAGGHEAPVLHRSVDGGKTWDEAPGLPPDAGYASSPYVIDAHTFLLGTYNGGGSGVFRSTDGGNTWTKAFAGDVLGAPVVATGKIQWLRRNGGVVTSTDNGVTWQAQAGQGVAESADRMIGMADGSLVTWGNGTLVRSTDDGAHWHPFGAALPYTPSGIAYSVGRNTFYVARADCSFDHDNPIKPDSILRLDPA